jgi:hypothetical protein
MRYKGHNHAVIRLQLELLGYWITIAPRTGDLMADADYFSRMGADISPDPLMKDYLAFRRLLYNSNTPPTDDINDNNMPGRRSKKPRPAEPTQHTNQVNLATVDW